VLSDRLAGLVDEGVVTRRVDPAHSGRHLYELTAAGRDLWPVIHALMMWGGRHHGRNSLRFRHAACGTLLDAGGACPECMVTPKPREIMSERVPGRPRRRTDAVSVALGAPHRLLEPIVA
jgi:DNA-binding MarR family transcriptional regulator